MRPQSFAEVIGQEHVTQTLTNAIRRGRVAHAFVFSGMRGVGKTTTARILAKALNCEQGPTPEPCNRCRPCVEITQGRSLDVFEVDAASQTGIDATRELLETVKYQPAAARFRVYIIDEAHGLSKQAVDAFLKTLEEPPAHAKFILATTAAHKLPATILSRCQRFDFRAVPLEEVTRALLAIVEREGGEADEAALRLIAREAGGSLRDATSLLDQVLAYGAGRIDTAVVSAALGLPDREALRALLAAIAARDAAAALDVVAAVLRQGSEPLRLAQGLLERLRNLVVLAVAGEDALRDLSPEEREELRNAAPGLSADDLQRLFRIALRGAEEVARAGQPRLVLEMAVVQLATLPPLVPLEALVARLERLERRAVAGGGGPGPARRTNEPEAAKAQGRPPPPPGMAQSRPASASRRPRAPEPAPAAAGEEVGGHPLQARWKALVARLQRREARRFFRLSYSSLLAVEGGAVRVRVASREARQALLEEETRRAIEAEIADTFGEGLRFEPSFVEEEGLGAAGRPTQATLDRQAREDPVVQLSVEVLDGRVEAVVPRTRRPV